MCPSSRVLLLRVPEIVRARWPPSCYGAQSRYLLLSSIFDHFYPDLVTRIGSGGTSIWQFVGGVRRAALRGPRIVHPPNLGTTDHSKKIPKWEALTDPWLMNTRLAGYLPVLVFFPCFSFSLNKITEHRQSQPSRSQLIATKIVPLSRELYLCSQSFAPHSQVKPSFRVMRVCFTFGHCLD